MSTKPHVPTYRRQKRSGRTDDAFVVIGGRRRYLGPYGSAEARAAYQKIVADYLASGGEPAPPPEAITVVELIDRYWQHVEKHYRDRRGRPTSRQWPIRSGMRWLKSMFSDTPAGELGPRDIKAMQAAMAAKLARPTVNEYVAEVKRLIRWATGEELIPAGVYQAIQPVPGLQAGRTEAREPTAINAVPPEHVEAVLPHVTSPIAAMIRLQRVTGMRPDEVATLTPAELDTTGEVWLYRPSHHKNAHRGQDRTVFIGPQGQRVLSDWLTPERPTHKPLFSPQDADAEVRQRRHESRTTPLSQGNAPGSNKKDEPTFAPGEQYTVASYRRAIYRACDAAGVPRWSPNRLRHLFATEVRRDHGLEAAQVLLGHTKADVTQVYAERDMQKAADVAARCG